MSSRGAQVSIIAAVCLILGIMLAMQFKANLESPTNLTSDRWAELTVQMDNLRKERDALAEEVLTLREKLAQSAAGSSSKAGAAMREELAKMNMIAGLTPVRGPGIIVVLQDSPAELQLGTDPNNYLIHDYDLLNIVNELKAAGAEAISINGQRLVASSEIRCAGPTIMINATRIASPFEIRAIGDPATLESSLRLRGGYVEQMELWGARVKIQRQENIEIPAYKGSIKFEYAKPDTD